MFNQKKITFLGYQWVIYIHTKNNNTQLVTRRKYVNENVSKYE